MHGCGIKIGYFAYMVTDEFVPVKFSKITTTLLKCKMCHQSIKRLNGYETQCFLPSFHIHILSPLSIKKEQTN